MNYQDLFFFIRIIDKGSLQGAADSLGIPSSTLSRRLQQLEEKLGYKLLHRSARKLALTEAGEQFYRKCQPLFTELEHTIQELEGELTSPTGTLRITAPVGLATEVLDDWFFEFLQHYPGIRLQLILENRTLDLQEEGIDIAFRIGEAKIKDWVSRSLFRSRFVLCASPDFIQQHGEPKSPDELSQFPLIVTARTPNWQFRNETGGFSQISPQPHIQVDELRTAAKAVVQGVAIGNLPGYVIDPIINRGEAVPIMPGWTPLGREIQLLYPHRKYIPLKVRLFVEFIMEQIQVYRKSRASG